MFEKITPEQAGISSKVISDFIEMLEDRWAATHGILFMKDGKIFTEGYWQPFHKDFCHRMYSQTKSFVGVAIGLLEEEGKLKLTDRIVDYFPEKIDTELSPYLDRQTIRDMLMMCTVGETVKWFGYGDDDRTHIYFSQKRKGRIPGALWAYDSPGSQVLASLVEKLSGKTLLDYLKEKIFNHIGAFKTAQILKTPNGDSWGDSAMVCTLRDMAVFGQFVMNYGVWEGKRLMNEEYLREATSKLTANALSSHFDEAHAFGYGYQIWRVGGNGFAFIGMGDQLTVCYPDKNLIFACTSDNQGTDLHRQNILAYLRKVVVPNIKDGPIEEDEKAYAQLQNKLKELKLRHLNGLKDVELRKKIEGVKYVARDNSMGIKEFTLTFNGDQGEFRYTNEQGDKVISFGINKNVFGKFPQLGYSNEYGGVPTTDGFMYDDAVSFTWLDENKCMLFVQIIDRYFANMSAIFAFNGDDVVVNFSRNAEAFLEEYNGLLMASKA